MAEATPKITAMENGPYQVLGNVPLVRKTPIKSDKGEAIGWQTSETVETESAYYLCRCGAYPEIIDAVKIAARNRRAG